MYVAQNINIKYDYSHDFQWAKNIVHRSDFFFLDNEQKLQVN